MRRSVFWAAVGLAGVVCAGCGDDDGGGGADASIDAAPLTAMLIPGGGAGGGPIAGKLFVHVIDEDTKAPLVGASVRVSATPNGQSPLTATTDATGLASFTDASLSGKQSLTVSAPSYAPSTWVGFNAGNVTVPLTPRTPLVVTPPTATVTGTITGWDQMPFLPDNHILAAFVGASSRADLGDDIQIDQGKRPVVGIGMVDANSCVRARSGATMISDCNWSFKTVAGPQALVAFIADVDLKGAGDADNTVTLIGYAVRTGFNFTAGQTVANVALAPIASTDLQMAAISFTNVPANLTQVNGFPLLDLGTEGRVFMFFSAVSPTVGMALVPKLVGPLSGARYDFIGQAQLSMTDEQPKSVIWSRNVNIGTTVTLSNWLAPPSGLSAAPATLTFGFTASPGVTVHNIEISDGPAINPRRVWSVLLADGSSSVTLPTLTPDPFPTAGTLLTMKVGALELPGLDINNFKIEDAQKFISRIGEDDISFNR